MVADGKDLTQKQIDGMIKRSFRLKIKFSTIKKLFKNRKHGRKSIHTRNKKTDR